MKDNKEKILIIGCGPKKYIGKENQEIINIDKAKMKVIITATMNELKSLMKVEIIEKEKILIKDVILNPYGFRSVFDIN